MPMVSRGAVAPPGIPAAATRPIIPAKTPALSQQLEATGVLLFPSSAQLQIQPPSCELAHLPLLAENLAANDRKRKRCV